MEISQFISKKAIKDVKSILKQNLGWLIGSSVAVIYAILKFINYISIKSYSNYYNIDYKVMDYGEINVIYGIISIIIFATIFLYTPNCIIKKKKKMKKVFSSKNKICSFGKTVMIFILTNLLGIWLLAITYDLDFIRSIILTMVFTFVEIFIYIINTRTEKTMDKMADKFYLNKTVNETIKYVIIFLLLIIICFIFLCLSIINIIIRINSTYRFVNGSEKVIIYSTKNQYIITDYTVEEGKLIINTDGYTIISNENISVNKKSFIGVHIN